jgi:hypothetical protein
MDKKLTAKVQKINPLISQLAETFASCILIEPESKELLLRKGIIYAVYGVSGEASFDTSLLSKVIHDVMHDSYYQSDNISPIQSLEKAIVDTRDKVAQLPNEAIRPGHVTLKFNIVAAVLWGNVLYVVQYGDYQGFLMRDGVVREINTMSEGNFAAASGVVKDSDVVIFSSTEFNNEYPPQKLLTTSIDEQRLQPNQACLLLKLNVDTNFSKDEIVDFGLEKAIQKNKNKELLKKSKVFATKVFNGLKERMPSKPRAVTAIGQISHGKKFKLVYFIPVLGAALLVAIFLTVKMKIQKPSVKGIEVASKTQTMTSQNQTDTSMDTVNKVQRIKDAIFYDVKITDPTANPNQLAVFNSYVVTADSTTGKIYVSTRDTPKFNTLSATYPGINSLTNINGKLSFADSKGYKVLSLATDNVDEQFTQSGITEESPYLSFVYTISGNALTRYAKANGALQGSLWAEGDDFIGAKSFVVAYNVYVATANDTVVCYLSGAKTDFTVTGIDKSFKTIVKIATNADADNIYVADRGNNRVVVLDKKGKFVKQYRAANDTDWSDIKSLDISPDEKYLYLLAGSKVYEIAL